MQIEKNKTYILHKSTAEEALPLLADASVDLVVTSPPYDKLRQYKGQNVFDLPVVVSQLFRVLKEGGVIVWIVSDSVGKNGGESCTSFRTALSFVEAGFRLHDTMIYEKDVIPFPDVTRYFSVFEYMFVFSKGKPKSFFPIKDRKNLTVEKGTVGRNVTVRTAGCDTVSKKEKQRVVPEYGVRTNIWRYSVGYRKSTNDLIAYKHPAIFPDKLARDCIVSWSREGDVVLDPFAGSGTTIKMAIQNNRSAIAIEPVVEYCDIIQERCRELASPEENLPDTLDV